MRIFTCLLALFFIFLPPIAPIAETFDQCRPKSPLFRDTMKIYAYRMKPMIEAHGCDVIPVYAAFGNGHGIVLDLAEANPQLMENLKNLLAATPALADTLHNSKNLLQALELRLQEEGNLQEFQDTIEALGSLGTTKAFDSAIAALALLVPHLSPQYLARNFSKNQLDLLFHLVSQTALTSSIADLEGFDHLLPYITTNPNEALNIYKKVLSTWGDGPLRRLLQKTPEAAPALIPPLTQEEMKDLNPLNSQPASFHKMQDEYIRLMRELYETVAAKYGAAWASEYCNAIADILPLALLDQDPSTPANLRRLLLDIASSDIFRTIFLPTACEGESNLSLFGSLLATVTTDSQSLGSRKHPLSALAEWNAAGTLFPLVQQWLNSTNPQKFAADTTALLEGGDGPDKMEDGIFWANLAQLAMIRSELPREQQALLDALLPILSLPQLPPYAPLHFVIHINQPLFQVLRRGHFQQPLEVARRLLLVGYPESTDSSLYKAFLTGERAGFMPDAGMAIEHRGSLPEGELLVHGQTFADRHWGWSADEAVDLGIDVVSVGVALAGTIVSSGAATPVLIGAVGRICGKQAARRAAAAVAKTVARGARGATRMIPRVIRPGVIRGVKWVGRGIKTVALPEKEPKSLPGKILHHADRVGNRLQQALNLYKMLTPAAILAEQERTVPESICPGRKEN